MSKSGVPYPNSAAYFGSSFESPLNDKQVAQIVYRYSRSVPLFVCAAIWTHIVLLSTASTTSLIWKRRVQKLRKSRHECGVHDLADSSGQQAPNRSAQRASSLRVNHHYSDGKSTWSSFFFTSTWLSAIIKRISPREKQWTVVCVILNIAGAILTHVLHYAELS